MKMIVVVSDGSGRFQCGLVRNPDLFRRDIAKATGAAAVVWAGLPVLATDACAMVTTIERCVLPRFAARPSLQHEPAFVLAMGWVVAGRPLVHTAWRRACRLFRNAVSIIPGLPTQRRTVTNGKAGEGA
ncbi:MAG: hypothetical protein Devi2KO_17330 [Devosia indica]